MEAHPPPEQTPIRGLRSLRGITVLPIIVCFGLIGSALLHNPESLSDSRLILPALFYGLYCTLVWWLIKSNPPRKSGVILAAIAGSVVAGCSIWLSFRIFERSGSRWLVAVPILVIAFVHVDMAGSAFITYNSLKREASSMRKIGQILAIPGIVVLLEIIKRGFT